MRRETARRPDKAARATVRVAVQRHHLFRQRSRNESSGTDLAFEISLRQELRIGVQNRKARDLDFGSPAPGWTESFVQAANRRGESLHDIRRKPVDAMAVRRFDPQQ